MLAIGLVGLAAVALLVDSLTDQRLQQTPRVILGLLLALAPAIGWLAFFYRRDRVEPEPKHLVATVALISGLFAAAIAEPALRAAPQAHGWVRWVVSITVVGMLREFVKYLAVVLVAIPAGEVNERADGIIYGTAAGLGYAAALNVAFIVDFSGPDLAPGLAWITVVTLVHAALGGFVGYLSALDILDRRSVWLVPTGLVAAAIFDGAFFESRASLATAVSQPGSEGVLGAWLGVGMAVAVAAAVTMGLTAVMREEERTT